MRIKNIASITTIALMVFSCIAMPAIKTSAQAEQVLTNIYIIPPAASIVTAEDMQFSAIAYDQYGQPMATQPTFVWDSLDPAIATVDQNGLVTAVAEGFSWLSAADINDPSGITGYGAITVENTASDPRLTTLIINPPAASISEGGIVQLEALAYDQHGVLLSPQPTFTWTSSETGVAPINSSGLVTGDTIGITHIYCDASDDFGQVTSDPIQIEVTSEPVLTSITIDPETADVMEGSTQQLTAMVLDQNDAPFLGATVSYESSDTSVATVDADGLVTAVTEGTATITATATSGDTTVTDTSEITVTVEETVLTSIALTPESATVSIGAMQQFTAVGLDQNGNPLAEQPIFIWSSGDSSLATVDSTGLAAGVASGTVDILAASGDMTAVSSLTIEEPVLTSITIDPETADVMEGSTQQLTAMVLDQNDAPFLGATVSYESSDTSVATVDADGLVTAVTEGTATITATATSGDTTVTDTSEITVTVEETVLTSIALTPESATISVGGTRQFTAIELDQDGNPLEVQPTFIWTSSETGIASVNSSGLVTGLTAGSSIITVSNGEVSSSATVSVQLLGVTQITAVQTFATADSTYENGWKWVLSATVPNNETILQMKFGDWISGTNSVTAANNIRFYSAQSSDANSAASAIEITAAGALSDALTLDSDLDSTAEGRQIQIVIEARIPTGSAGGSYTTSYGIQTNTAAQ